MTYVEKLNKLIPNVKNQKESVLKNADSNLLCEIKNLSETFPENLNIRQRAKLLDTGYNSNNHPKCKICNSIHFIFDENKNISHYCSKTCRYKDKEYTTNRVKNINQKQKIEKMKSTNIKKYGVEFQSQRTEVKSILQKSKIIDENKLNKLLDKDWLLEEYKTKPATAIADEIGVYYGTVIDYLRKYDADIKQNYNKSYGETEIISFIKSISYCKIIQSHSIEGFEADIFLPENNLAIEYNGTYWHSHVDYTKQYKHINKKLLFQEKNIKLMQFTDLEWKNKKPIVQSMISSSLGIYDNKIRASKCQIIEIDNDKTKQFCENNHINGYAQSKINIGLIYENELISIMTFAKPRFDKNSDYEIIRLCSKLNHIVYGGASKMMKYFIEKYKPNSIMTYSDLSYGNGNVYKKIGFELTGRTEPGYFWVNSKGDILSRYQTTKSKLKLLFEDYNDETQREFMVSKGYKMYFNCGHNIHWYSNQI